VRLRLMAPVLLVIAVIAGAFAVTRIESLRDGVLVLAGGLALAAVTGVLAVTTERRRRAMREVERYFTLSPEMVILAGFDGYWKRVNPAVEAVLGYTEREALARPFMEFVHPDDRERTEEEARRVVDGATALRVREPDCLQGRLLQIDRVDGDARRRGTRDVRRWTRHQRASPQRERTNRASPPGDVGRA
jgi:PAS domain S-box-containing protein